MRYLSVLLLAVSLSLLFIGCYHSKHRPIDVYLTVESEYGSPIPPVGSNYLNYGMTITASVSSPVLGQIGTRYVCTGWTGTGAVPPTGTENSCQFTIKENSTIAWTWKTQYLLTTDVSPLDSGTITPASDWYDANTVLSCTAIANTGYAFSSWSGDLSDSNNPETLTMDGPKSVTANFILVWAKSYGGANDDSAPSIQQTSDGGYIVAGYTRSFGAGYVDFWVLKLNSDGAVSWQKRYGSASWDYASLIQQTSDGEYIVAGYTQSFGAGGWDFWVLELNSEGTVAWQKTYGGASHDLAYSIQQTTDGGYIVAGAGYGDLWVLKLKTKGSVAWQKAYSGSGSGCANSIQQTSDGGYIVAGVGYGALCVLKLNTEGGVSWQKTYGGLDLDYATSIHQTSDGGYIVAGITSSFGAGGSDFWVLKLNTDGTVSWQKTYGGAKNEWAHSIQQTSDGGYIVAGLTGSFGAGSGDFWVLKLNSDGTVSWQKTYGGASGDAAYSIQQTSDGGYIVAGETDSFGAGGRDAWVLKLASDGTIPFNPASGAQMTDTAAVPVDTNCTVADTTATVADTEATVTDTNATVVDTDATIQQQAP
jgi:uncharacterized delta-60 repeat protein